MTWVGAFTVFMLTAVASFPALMGAMVFGDLLGERELRTAIEEQGIQFWLVALLGLVSAVPSLVSGMLSGGFALLVARRLFPAAETGAMVVAASGALAVHTLATPLLFSPSAMAPKLVQATGALLAYVAVGLMAGGLDAPWRTRFRRAWTVLAVAAMVECAALPLIVLPGLDPEAAAEAEEE